MGSSPLVSIIIVTWNSRKYLLDCLDHLLTQTFDKFEIILVDNGSKDNTLDGLYEKYPPLELRIHELNSNLGFAAANNVGARLARGQWLALLNTDAFPEPAWLEHLLLAAEKHPEFSFFSSRQVRAGKPEFLDGTGDIYHASGLAWRRHYNLPTEKFGHQIAEVFSACGAAAFYRREDFLNAGGFDEEYFSYFEDVDLGFRLRLSGKRCLYIPHATIHHIGSASTGKRSDFSVYYGYRNLIWTFFKDMPVPLLLIFLPLHIGTMLFFLIYLSLRGQANTIVQAMVDALRGLPNIVAKRKSIHQNRKTSSFDLVKVMSISLLEPYLAFARRNNVK